MPSAQLLGPVAVDRRDVRVGESVRIDATRPDGTPWNGEEDFVITINGVRGSTQYLQFSGPGKRQIVVTAGRDGQVERREASIDVTEASAPATPAGTGQVRLMSERLALQPALLHVERAARDPYRVSFSIGAFPISWEGLVDDRVDPPVSNGRADLEALPHWAKESFVHLTARSTVMPSETTATPIHIEEFRSKRLKFRGVAAAFEGPVEETMVPLHVPETPPQLPTYHWDLGDGTQATTNTPTIEHDYEDALGPDRDHQQFHIRARVEIPGEDPREVVRTLTVYSGYVLAKRLGTITPKVTAEGDARKVLNGFEASFTVKNIEPFALTLTSMRVEAMNEDPDAQSAPGPEVPLAAPIEIAANSSVVIPVRVEFDEVPSNAPGFVVYYAGTGDGTPVRVEAHFDVAVRDHESSGILLRDLAVTHLGRVRSALEAARDLVDPPEDERMTGRPIKIGRASERMALRAQMRTFAEARSESAALTHLLMTPKTEVRRLVEASPFLGGVLTRYGIHEDIFSHIASIDSPTENSECDPDNIPDGLPEELVCQATDEKRIIPFPGRFMNARKGDVILSPGGNGKIGGLLRQVTPPQLYSHSGIMTRNRDQITHSTASEERMQAYPVGRNPATGEEAPTDGFRPDVVKYGWPGVITQSVDGAIWGDWMADPERPDKKYRISSFSPYRSGMEVDGQWEIVPPLVVKPDPMQETPETRAKLHEIASYALAQAGKSHYRFYCYTDPTIGFNDRGPDSAGWAKDTYPSVCSSFIWMCLKQNSVQLESATEPIPDSALEPADRAAGAMVNEQTRDGLYLYKADERRRAGEWLYNSIYEDAMKKAGFFGRLLTDAPDDIANQLLNAFASDWTDTEAKDSDDWKNAKDANAVSPDNVLLWDSPQLSSFYGYASPVVYREARYEEVTVHRWKKVFQHGDVSGVVRKDGQPVAGALVQLQDGLSDFTDRDGRYEIKHVAVGHWEAIASLDTEDGHYRSGKVSFDLNGPSATVDIDLAPPLEDFRLLRIAGTVKIHDSETFGDDEESGLFPVFKEMHLQPWSTHDEFTWVQGFGGEMRIEINIRGDLHIGRGINVNVDSKLFEGTDEDTDDLDGTNHHDYDLQPEWWHTYSLHLANEDEGGDWSQIDLKFENVVNEV